VSRTKNGCVAFTFLQKSLKGYKILTFFASNDNQCGPGEKPPYSIRHALETQMNARDLLGQIAMKAEEQMQEIKTNAKSKSDPVEYWLTFAGDALAQQESIGVGI
jgi:hypothetical protein